MDKNAVVLERLSVALTAGLPIPADLAGWLISAIRQLRDGCITSWDEALGWEPPSREERLSERNELIRLAAAYVSGKPKTIARRLVEGRDLPPQARQARTQAAHVMRLPRSERQLLRIIQ